MLALFETIEMDFSIDDC